MIAAIAKCDAFLREFEPDIQDSFCPQPPFLLAVKSVFGTIDEDLEVVRVGYKVQCGEDMITLWEPEIIYNPHEEFAEAIVRVAETLDLEETEVEARLGKLGANAEEEGQDTEKLCEDCP